MNYNSGYDNSGYYNSGNHNSGHFNSGYHNSGHGNSGHGNSGDFNSGHSNSGDHNSGDFCSCDFSSGVFMSKKITFEAFNKKLSKEEYDELVHSSGFRILLKFRLSIFKVLYEKRGKRETKHLSYKASWRIFWDSLSLQEKSKILKMPHFDPDVFFEITGIRVKRRRK